MTGPLLLVVIGIGLIVYAARHLSNRPTPETPAHKLSYWFLIGQLAAGLFLLLCVLVWLLAPTPTPTTQTGAAIVLQPTEATGLTYRQIEDKFNALTDLQRESYLPTLVGQGVHWRGKVTNVESDGSLDLNVGQRGLFYNVAMTDVPKDIAVKLNREDAIEFQGVITKAVQGVGLDITIRCTWIANK